MKFEQTGDESSAMLICGIVLAVLGTAGIFTAVGMELKAGEPLWKLLQKVTAWVIGVGMFLVGLSFAVGR